MKIEIKKPTEEEIQEILNCPIWECEPSEFPWTYSETEVCYLLEGKVRISTDSGEFEFGAGDMVSFSKGLSCNWNVIEKVRKHYRFES